jgi:OOP family OmpA-OmpF porin
MKKLNLSVIAFIFLGILSYGGGDINPVTEYETEDEYIAEEAGVEEEEYYNEVEVEPEPITTSEEVISDEVEEEVVVPEEPEEEEVIISEPEVTPIPPTPMPTVAPTPVPKPPKVVAKPPITPNGMYVGLGISSTRYKDSCYCDTKSGRVKVENKDTTYGVMGRVGYDFNQYIGVEARASKTNWKSDGTRVGHVGAFLKPMVPVTDNTNVYGLVGVAKTKTKGSMPHVDTTALALGAGVEVDLSQDVPKNGRYNREFDGHGDQESGFGLFLDYERMVVKKDAPKLDSVSAGISYDF